MSNINVAFFDNQLNERGTTIALYNYAYYNEELLGNKSYIFYNNKPTSSEVVIKKFKNRFIVHEIEGLNNFKDIDNLLEKYNIKHIFIIKGGVNDGCISKTAINCVQCVFSSYEPHGEVYCSISPYISKGKHPVIPRIITLPDSNINMRNTLNIPDSATVFGGYGGMSSFNISFVHKVVYDVAKNNSNIYFLFANFSEFCPKLKNIIHLSTIYDLEKKVEFINTCDAMLWARSHGETFGQAIAEFSIKNKPVIASKVGDLAHVDFLGDKGIWYNNYQDLTEIILKFNPDKESKKDWNTYRDYTPEKVMKIFKEIFLDYGHNEKILTT